MSPTVVPSLRHFEPDDLVLRRVRRGRGFSYHDAAGARIDDPQTLNRIRALAIPPAWTDVRISDRADSHLQAIGRDARGRMQYRYHSEWRTFRDRVKFDRLAVFGETLPAVRAQIARDLAQTGVPRDKVIATIVALLQTTLIRVGNEEYAKTNGAYGLTTFRNRHARISGSEMRFVFVGKSGLHHDVHVRDARVARVLRRCQEIPGQRLFQYLDPDNGIQPVYSNDVNDYLRDAAGVDITAKDFRTWVATVSAAAALGTLDPPSSDTESKAVVNEVIRDVALELGNTPAVCRASYIHPKVLTDFASGALRDEWSVAAPRRAGLTLEERHTLLVIDPSQRRQRRQRAAAPPERAARAASTNARADTPTLVDEPRNGVAGGSAVTSVSGRWSRRRTELALVISTGVHGPRDLQDRGGTPRTRTLAVRSSKHETPAMRVVLPHSDRLPGSRGWRALRHDGSSRADMTRSAYESQRESQCRPGIPWRRHVSSLCGRSARTASMTRASPSKVRRAWRSTRRSVRPNRARDVHERRRGRTRSCDGVGARRPRHDPTSRRTWTRRDQDSATGRRYQLATYLDSGMVAIRARRVRVGRLEEVAEAMALEQLARAIFDAERPDVVVTYDPKYAAGHPDHRQTHDAVCASFQPRDTVPTSCTGSARIPRTPRRDAHLAHRAVVAQPVRRRAGARCRPDHHPDRGRPTPGLTDGGSRSVPRRQRVPLLASERSHRSQVGPDEPWFFAVPTDARDVPIPGTTTSSSVRSPLDLRRVTARTARRDLFEGIR